MVASRLKAFLAVILALGLVAGCSTRYSGSSVTHTYEPLFNFTQVKTYRWVESKSYGWDPLLESNVRFIAGKTLGAKGFSSSAEKPDLLISMRYEREYGDALRTLTLTISRADSNAQVWRGTATGDIKTDADYTDLKSAIERMLAHFPPK